MDCQPISGALQVNEHPFVEGESWITLDCNDYDHFRSLPAAVLFDGRTHAKSAWNSDRNVAYYTDAPWLMNRVAKVLP